MSSKLDPTLLTKEEKQKVATELQKILKSLNHPSLQSDNIVFSLSVFGDNSWKFASIINNSGAAIRDAEKAKYAPAASTSEKDSGVDT